MIQLVWPGRAEAEALLKGMLSERDVTVSLLDPAESRRQCKQGAELLACPRDTLFDDTSAAAPPHRLIRADNLDALTWFLRNNEQFDLIYIDPPYNTGREFAYTDRHASPRRSRASRKDTDATECSSAQWLSMMFPRLALAHRLLSSRGLMCVSIDDNEVHHLVTVMREIFGAGSHVATIKWKRKRKPSFLRQHVSSVFEYVLLFAKDRQALPRLLGKESAEETRPVLNQGNAWVDRVIPRGTPAYCGDLELPAGRQGVRTLAFELLDTLVISEGRVQHPCRVRGPFRVRQEILNQTLFVTQKRGLRRRVLPGERARQHATDDGSNWSTNEDADSELQKLFGDRVFPFAKPTGMLRQLLRMYPTVGGGLKCLDFFAGSGSFAHAVLAENQTDGNLRSVTLVQSGEPYRGPALSDFDDIFSVMRRRLELASQQLGLSFSDQFLTFDLKSEPTAESA